MTAEVKTEMDDETDQLFSDLKKQLEELDDFKKNEKAITESLETSKDAVKKLDDPNYVAKAIDVVKGIGPSLAKFKTGDPYDIAEGSFAIISTVTAAFPAPVGPGLSALATLISSIIPLFKPTPDVSFGYIFYKNKSIQIFIIKKIIRTTRLGIVKKIRTK